MITPPTPPTHTCTLLANFGGPRNLEEIQSFLTALLTDRDVVRTGLPGPLHNFIFRRIARKRVEKVKEEYASMGGKSPIYGDTEALAKLLRERLTGPVITFHRYLPNTHEKFIQTLSALDCDEIRIFPLFPQFTYATSGSIARWFRDMLPYSLLNKMRWIKSYPTHPAFVQAHQNSIREFINANRLQEDQTVLFFSSHGIPQKFIETQDIYRDECQRSFEKISAAFPKTLCRLGFQSKFGPGEWLRPYTIDLADNILEWTEGRQEVVFIPLSFTSDHIETLCEIENDYMTVVREKGLNAYRVPALTLRPDWIEAIITILEESDLCNNQMLVRPTL